MFFAPTTLAQSLYEMPQAIESRAASGENPTVIQNDYEILPKITGKGRYLGTNIGVIVNSKEYFNTWWGEGEVKMYIDGDSQFPTIVGTGTDDYVGTKRLFHCCRDRLDRMSRRG